MAQPNLLPTVPFGPYTITRLIIGGNPFIGGSHRGTVMAQDMQEYYTPERVIEALFEAERQGLNTVQTRGDLRFQAIFRDYHEQGGALQWIAQTASELPDIDQNIRDMADVGAIAIYNHGTDTDRRFFEGTMDVIRARLDLIHDLGLPAGVASHVPEILRWTEDEGWPVDFYMACVYDPVKNHRDPAVADKGDEHGEYYSAADRDRMCEFIRETDRQCLAFKILAASRNADTPEAVREAFEYAFANIKPTDAVVVGMFQKYVNQVEMNAMLVSELG